VLRKKSSHVKNLRLLLQIQYVSQLLFCSYRISWVTCSNRNIIFNCRIIERIYIFLRIIILDLKQQHDIDILLTLYDSSCIYQLIDEDTINKIKNYCTLDSSFASSLSVYFRYPLYDEFSNWIILRNLLRTNAQTGTELSNFLAVFMKDNATAFTCDHRSELFKQLLIQEKRVSLRYSRYSLF